MEPNRPSLMREVVEVAREMLPGSRGWAVITLVLVNLIALFFYDNWDAINAD